MYELSGGLVRIFFTAEINFYTGKVTNNSQTNNGIKINEKTKFRPETIRQATRRDTDQKNFDICC